MECCGRDLASRIASGFVCSCYVFTLVIVPRLSPGTILACVNTIAGGSITFILSSVRTLST